MALERSAILTALLLSVFNLDARSEVVTAKPAEAQPQSNWQIQCLGDLSEALEPELELLKAEHPSPNSDSWRMVVVFKDGEARVRFTARQLVSYPVKFGHYLFSCSDRTIEFVPDDKEE